MSRTTPTRVHGAAGTLAAARWSCLPAAIVLAVFLLGGDAKSSTAGATFTIYSSLPMQGDSRRQSVDISRAMRMALRDHGNKAGRHRIRYVSLDDAGRGTGRWEAERVGANARRAARDRRAIAYLGEFNSPASSISIPILNVAGLLQVSPSNTTAGLTRSEGAEPGEPDKYYPSGRRTYGRVVPADHTQAAAVVSYMKAKGCTSASIINDRGVYGAGLAGQVELAGNRQGLRILADEALELSSANVRAAAARMKVAGAGCFFFSGLAFPDGVRVFQIVAAVARGIKLFGPDAVAASSFTQRLGSRLEKRVFMTNPTLGRRAYPARGQRFFRDFRARYGRYPQPYAIYGYEAMSVVLSSIRRADRPSTSARGRRAVVDAFFAQRGRRSVLGTYGIDEFGDTTLPVFGGFKSVAGKLVFDRVIRVPR